MNCAPLFKFVLCMVVQSVTLDLHTRLWADELGIPSPYRLDFLEGRPWRISGEVFDRERSPIAQADVSVYAMPTFSLVPRIKPVLVGETVSNARGEFAAVFPSLPYGQFDSLWIVVCRDGYGIVGRELEGDLLDHHQLGFELLKERTVFGTVLTPTGQAAPGVEVSVDRLSLLGHHDIGPGAPGMKAWLRSTVTDGNGQFAIHRLPSEVQSLQLSIDDDRFAPQKWSVAPAGGGRWTEMTLKTSDAYVIEGSIVGRDTRKPIPGCWLQVAVTDLPVTGDLQVHSRQLVASDEGVFRARCAKGKWVVVYVYPPEGTPYPAWTMPRVRLPEGKKNYQLRIQIPRGILVSGLVKEKTTGAPVSGARVTYWVQRGKGKNEHLPGSIVTHTYWASEYRSVVTDHDGRFKLAVLPGTGYLLTKSPAGGFVSNRISYLEAQGEGPGGRLYNTDGYTELDYSGVFSDASRVQTVVVELARGKDVILSVTGANGEPVASAMLLDPDYTQNRYTYDSSRRAIPVRNGAVVVRGCDLSTQRIVYLLDVAKQQAATVSIDAAAIDRGRKSVRLQPCGSATLVLNDQSNQLIRQRLIQGDGIIVSAELIAEESAHRPNKVGGHNFLRFVKWSMQSLDRERQRQIATNSQGKAVFPTLIPNANYRLIFRVPSYLESSIFRVSAGQSTEVAMQIPD